MSDELSGVDQRWMEHALALAEQGRAVGEVPVGAVVVSDDQVLGEGFNQPITTSDPTAHAEIIALRAAARALNNYRLPNATLYVTLEPCTMCAGAIVHARIARLVYGTVEPKAGVVESRAQLLDAEYLNHRVEVSGGVMASECQHQLQEFFRERRAELKALKQKEKNAEQADKDSGNI